MTSSFNGIWALFQKPARWSAILPANLFIDYHQNIRVELEYLSKILLLLNKNDLVAIVSFLLMIREVRECDVQDVTHGQKSDKAGLPKLRLLGVLLSYYIGCDVVEAGDDVWDRGHDPVDIAQHQMHLPI